MTQHVTEHDVRDIAEYTRIGLTDEEVSQMTVDLNAIIDSLAPIAPNAEADAAPISDRPLLPGWTG